MKTSLNGNTAKESGDWASLKLWGKIVIGIWVSLFVGIGYFGILAVEIYGYITDKTNGTVYGVMALATIAFGIFGAIQIINEQEHDSKKVKGNESNT
jgi:hypothetical protein